MKRYPDITEELTYLEKGCLVIGIDEVGRGCLAGPVYAAAVCLGRTIDETRRCLSRLPEVTDSKMMSQKAREKADPRLKRTVFSYGIAYSSASDINEYGIVKATSQAMVKAIHTVLNVIPNYPIMLLVDGLAVAALHKIPGCSQRSYIKGDSKVLSIAAASVIAKVSRDNHMMGLHKSLNKYRWDKNKGYGTAYHKQAILEHGLTEEHRRLFVRNTLKAL